MYFLKNLNYLLKKENLNKNRLSIKLNVSRQYMTDLFKTENPTAKTLVKLKEIFNISIDDLLLKDLEAEEAKK